MAPRAMNPGDLELVDDDRSEITVKLDGQPIRGWHYADETGRKVRMYGAREFVEGYSQASNRAAAYLIWSNEHRAWWGPNSHGYTKLLQAAGRYQRSEALAICAGAAFLREGIRAELPVREIDALALPDRMVPAQEEKTVPVEMEERDADGTVTKSVAKFRIMPPPPGRCTTCGHTHDADEPHNNQTLYYQYAFYGAHHRRPTWADAVAHCTDEVRNEWATELKLMGAWTEPPDGAAPIAMPYEVQR